MWKILCVVVCQFKDLRLLIDGSPKKKKKQIWRVRWRDPKNILRLLDNFTSQWRQRKLNITAFLHKSIYQPFKDFPQCSTCIFVVDVHHASSYQPCQVTSNPCFTSFKKYFQNANKNVQLQC